VPPGRAQAEHNSWAVGWLPGHARVRSGAVGSFLPDAWPAAQPCCLSLGKTGCRASRLALFFPAAAQREASVALPGVRSVLAVAESYEGMKEVRKFPGTPVHWELGALTRGRPQEPSGCFGPWTMPRRILPRLQPVPAGPFEPRAHPGATLGSKVLEGGRARGQGVAGILRDPRFCLDGLRFKKDPSQSAPGSRQGASVGTRPSLPQGVDAVQSRVDQSLLAR
jgi:hypothetical protein